MYYIFATSNKQRREIKWSRCNMMPRCFRSGISSNMRERSFLPSAVSGWRQRRSSTGSGRLWSVLLRPSVAGRCAICCSESPGDGDCVYLQQTVGAARYAFLYFRRDRSGAFCRHRRREDAGAELSVLGSHYDGDDYRHCRRSHA